MVVLSALPAWLLAQPGVAVAAEGGPVGQSPAALTWMKLADTRGISVWNYELSVDRGGLTSPITATWAFVIELFWQLYLSGVTIAIWFIDFALSFRWLATVVGPVRQLADSLILIVTRVGGTTTLLTLAALVAVVWMARGKWALGLFELMLSLVIASLAGGALANPVDLVAGPDGLLMESRQLGLEVADGLATGAAGGGGPADAEALRKATTGRLVDTFVRLPLQTINFGVVLDGGKCQGAYDQVLRDGPYGTQDDIREAVAGCDEQLGEVAANPAAGQAVSAIVLSPASLLVIAFAIVLAGTVLLASVLVLYQALKLIVTLVWGLLPGSGRGPLWMTVADLVMGLVLLVFSIAFLGGYLLLISDVFTSRTPDDSPMEMFFFLDVLLVVALLIFWRGRKAIGRASGRLAQALATRPGGGASALPARQPFNAANAYYKARMTSTAVKGAAGVAGSAAGAAAGALAGPAGKVGAAWVTGRDAAYESARGGVLGAGIDLRAAGAWWRWANAGTAGGAAGGRTARPHGGPGPGLPPGPRRALPPGDSAGPDEPQPSPAGGGPGSSGGAPQRLTAALQDRQPAGGSGRLVHAAGRLALAAATGGTSDVAVTAGAMAVRSATGKAAGIAAVRAAAGPQSPDRPVSRSGAGSVRTGGADSPAAPRVDLVKSAGSRPGASGPGSRQTGPGHPRPPARTTAGGPARGPGAGRVIDQDGRELPAATERLQARLDARRRRQPAGR